MKFMKMSFASIMKRKFKQMVMVNIPTSINKANNHL